MYHVLDRAGELDGARFLAVAVYGAGQGDDAVLRVYVDLQATDRGVGKQLRLDSGSDTGVGYRCNFWGCGRYFAIASACRRGSLLPAQLIELMRLCAENT